MQIYNVLYNVASRIVCVSRMIHLCRVGMYNCGRTIDGRIRGGGIPGLAIASARSTDIAVEVVIFSVISASHLRLTKQFKESLHIMTLGNWNGLGHLVITMLVTMTMRIKMMVTIHIMHIMMMSGFVCLKNHYFPELHRDEVLNLFKKTF